MDIYHKVKQSYLSITLSVRSGGLPYVKGADLSGQFIGSVEVLSLLASRLLKAQTINLC